MPVPKVLERLVGLQAQAPKDPYFGLWTRLNGFRPDTLARLISNRRVVRIALMRATIHLVTARDCLALRPVLQPVLDRNLYVGSPYGRRIAGADIDALVAAGRRLVDEHPRTTSDLGKRLLERWPDRDATALAYAIRNLVPLVQVPPRGLWGKSGQAICTTAEAWLDRPLGTDTSPDKLITRYLTAFGPATVMDIQAWSGLTRLGDVIERLRPRLRTFRDEHGRELLDVPGAPRPDPDTPAPPRFLPEYDNVFLGHADRTRIVGDNPRAWAPSNVATTTVLIDGFMGGTWKITRHRTTATLIVRPLRRLSKTDTVAVTREGARLLAFAAGDAETHDVRVAKR